MVRPAELPMVSATGSADWIFLDSERRRRSGAAVDKAVAMMLRAQIRVDGRPTAWCAQHDEVTLEPGKARAYEHPSLSASGQRVSCVAASSREND
jgi:PelA/Pel-15E family pectate lyase